MCACVNDRVPFLRYLKRLELWVREALPIRNDVLNVYRSVLADAIESTNAKEMRNSFASKSNEHENMSI